MVEKLFHLIVDASYEHITGHIQGYQRRKVLGEVYPALVSGQMEDRVNGMAYLDVSMSDLERLDKFEGEMYHRVSINMTSEKGEILEVETYLCKPDYLHHVDQETWRIQDFDAMARKRFLNHFPGWKE